MPPSPLSSPRPQGKTWFSAPLDFALHLLCLHRSSPSPHPRLAQFTSFLCPATQDPPGEQRPILWAPKWVDYSSKYGFGYQLSDGGSGVLLRDGTHMALHPPGE